jgi:hypothetical protein
VAETEHSRRSGWLWLWIALFVAAVLLLILWAWPASRPAGSGPDLSSANRIAVITSPAPASTTGRTATAARPAELEPAPGQAATRSSTAFSASRFERL